MPPADSPQDVFKRALAHAARALAEQPELEVVFGSEGPRLSDGVLTLPHPPRTASEGESATLRGQADRLALRLANHDATIHARARPIDSRAAEVFEAVEQARVEVSLKDDWTYEAARLVREAIEALTALEVES